MSDRTTQLKVAGNSNGTSASGKRKRDGCITNSSSRENHQTVIERRDVQLEESLVSPNFEELARRYPAFRQAYQQIQPGRSWASQMTQEFSIALTQGLLHMNFGINLARVPLNQLCPPVPNRYFFVQWIQRQLLPISISSAYFNPVSSTPLSYTGLDIGTGSSCIYPLLFVASWSTNDPPYSMYATDIDKASVEFARENVRANKLEDRIVILPVEPSYRQQQEACDADMEIEDNKREGPLIKSWLVMNTTRRLDFCMTNPPFYGSLHECQGVRGGDGRERTAMTSQEGIYPGGEVGFIEDMIADGLILAEKGMSPRWSACMCAKKSSFLALRNTLVNLLGYAHVHSAEFSPGHLTRWFLAWSFDMPSLSSPLAEVRTFDFAVHLSCCDTNETAQNEIAGRFKEFSQREESIGLSFQLMHVASDVCTLEIKCSAAGDCKSTGTSDIPAHLAATLERVLPSTDRWSVFVPAHFVLFVEIRGANVRAKAFIHTHHGSLAITKLKQLLPGEINRTNRYWRRKMKHGGGFHGADH